MVRDHDTCLVLQGFSPYSGAELLCPVVRPVLGGGGVLRGAVRVMVLLPFLTATGLRSLRRPSRRRTFLAAAPNLASHVRVGRLAPGTDWARVPEEVEAWAATHNAGSPLNERAREVPGRRSAAAPLTKPRSDKVPAGDRLPGACRHRVVSEE